MVSGSNASEKYELQPGTGPHKWLPTNYYCRAILKTVALTSRNTKKKVADQNQYAYADNNTGFILEYIK